MCYCMALVGWRDDEVKWYIYLLLFGTIMNDGHLLFVVQNFSVDYDEGVCICNHFGLEDNGDD